MTPDELRTLADALEPMAKAPRLEDFDVPAFCAWVRAQADAQPVAWMYEHDGCVDTPLFTVNRWTKCEEPWNESPLFLHPAPAVPQAEPKHELTADERDMIGSALRSSVRLAARRGWRAEAKPASGDDLNVYREIADGYRNDAQVEPKREDQPLRDLLAVIHRDGGHHTAAVGIEQSIKDAQAAVCELKRELAMGKHDPVLIDLLKQAEKCLAAGVRVDQTAPDEPPISEWDYEADRLSAEIFAWMKVHGIGGSDGN